jgi:hypothetical protein
MTLRHPPVTRYLVIVPDPAPSVSLCMPFAMRKFNWIFGAVSRSLGCLNSTSAGIGAPARRYNADRFRESAATARTSGRGLVVCQLDRLYGNCRKWNCIFRFRAWDQFRYSGARSIMMPFIYTLLGIVVRRTGPQPRLGGRHVPKDAVPERHCVRERGVHHAQRRPRANPRGAGQVGGQLSGGDPVRSVVSRLARLERLNRLSTGPQRLRIQYGYLKKLPDDYTGPRHVVTVRQLPPGPGAYSGEDWFEWEERPGPEPASNATSPNDVLLVRVCYVEAKRKA